MPKIWVEAWQGTGNSIHISPMWKLQSAFDALVNSKFEQAKEALEEDMLMFDKRSKLIILVEMKNR